MEDLNKDQPAFPTDRLSESNGLTKKEYFTAKAMQAIILRPDFMGLADYQKDETFEMYLKRKAQLVADFADIQLDILSK